MSQRPGMLRIGTALLLAFIILGGMLVWHSRRLSPESMASCFSDDLHTVIDPRCLKGKIVSLLHTYSPETLLTYASATSSPTVIRTNCHYVGHVIGEELMDESPSLESALTRCSAACNDGCTHGAIGEAVAKEMGTSYDDSIAHASTSTLEAIGKKYCAESATLCHGIGHILFLSTGRYRESLTICNASAQGLSREGCYQGVFMESFGANQSLFYSESPVEDSDSPGYPCATLTSPYQHACFRYLPGLVYARGTSRSKADFRTVYAATCAQLSSTARAYCFQGLGYDGGISQGYFDDAPQIATICAALSTGDDRASCAKGMLDKYTLYQKKDDGAAYCAQLTDPAVLAVCATYGYR